MCSGDGSELGVRGPALVAAAGVRGPALVAAALTIELARGSSRIGRPTILQVTQEVNADKSAAYKLRQISNYTLGVKRSRR